MYPEHLGKYIFGIYGITTYSMRWTWHAIDKETNRFLMTIAWTSALPMSLLTSTLYCKRITRVRI
eukprot:3702636-Amphidinium_carterae.1